MKIKLIFLMALSLGLAHVTLGHNEAVHKAITFNAAESAYADSSAYAGFIDVISADVPLNFATNAMVEASAKEDAKREDQGGFRSLNHFYDPLTGQGLSNIPLDDRIAPFGRDSLTWASTRNCPGINFLGNEDLDLGVNVNTRNVWSWQNARGRQWEGLTAATRLERQAALADMFRAVGQVVHLLEDTTSPQHVRNEQHLSGSPIGRQSGEYLAVSNIAEFQIFKEKRL